MVNSQRSIVSIDTVLKYTGVFGGVQGLKMLISIIRNKLASNLLGPAGIGLMGIYINVSDFLASCTNMGIPLSGVQQLAEHSQEDEQANLAQTVAVIRSWCVVASVAAMLLCVALAPLLGTLFSDGENTVSWEIALLAPMVGALLLTGGELTVLKGTRHLKRVAIISALSAIMTLLVTVPFFWALGTKGIIAALDISTLCVLMVHLWFSVQLYPWRIAIMEKWVWQQGWPMVRTGIPYVLASIATSGVAMALPALMLRYGTMDDVGHYRVGYMIMVTYTSIVFTAIDTDYFPRLSSVNHDPLLRNQTLNQQIRVSVLVLAPLLICVLLPMPLLIRLLYSEEFLPVANMAVCSVFYTYLKGITTPIGYLPLASGHSLLYLCMEVAYDIVSLAIIVSCYREWGLTGAGIGLSLSSLFDLTMLSLIYGRYYKIRLSWATLRIMLPQTLVVGFAMMLCLTATTNLTRYGYGVCCLLLSLWLSFSVLAKESHIVRQWIKVRRREE